MPETADYTDMGAAMLPLTDREQYAVTLPDGVWSDVFACKVAVQDFQAAEAYRTQNADWRWRNSDELYQAWVQQKYWEGTRIPRASIGVFTAFEQIESMLPKLLSNIFSNDPWFETDPEDGSTPEAARLWSRKLLGQMDRMRVREIYRRCIKSGLLYGNGIAKLSWTLREMTKVEWHPAMRPKMRRILHPLMGMIEQFDGLERILAKQTVRSIENGPQLDYVSIKDFYIDPNCASPQVQDGRFCAERKLLTVEDLDLCRDLPEFKIPSKMDLLNWATQKPSTQGDNTKAVSELYRQGQWAPQIDSTVDPAGLRVEVIAYTTKDRVVWVANRERAILNIPNSYGFMGYYDAFYADVLDRFYAMGVADVVEGEQRLQSSILNARLDELALSIHRPVKKKRGLNTPQYMLRVRPGQVIEMDDPEKDYKLMETENITAQAFVEVESSQGRVQRYVGQADLYSTGVASPGGNSASRTATGIGAQVNAGGSRIQYLVENLEDTFIEPMLNDLITLNHLFPPIGERDAEIIASTMVKASMRASSKMQSRMGLLQSLPLLLQTITGTGVLQDLALNGETINWEEILLAVSDMTGWVSKAGLIRKLSPEEQQKRNAPPTEELMKAKMQEQRLIGQQVIQREKLQASQQAEMQKTQLDIERERALTQLKGQLELLLKREELTADMQREGQKLLAEQSMEREKLAVEAAIEREKIAVEREKIDAAGMSSDHKILMELTKAMIAANSKEETEIKSVERDTEGLIKRVIQSVAGQDSVKEIERDTEGNIVRIRTLAQT